MSAPDQNPEAAFFRKLVFGARAGAPNASHAPAPDRGAVPATGALPGGVSGGEDFGKSATENV